MHSMWFRLVLATVIVAVVTSWAFRTTTEVQVSTTAVTDGPIARRVVATGILQPGTLVEVGTQISGVVQSLEADYNSRVQRGQIVARLDPSSYDAQLSEARGALAQAEADMQGLNTRVDDAQTKLDRAAALSAKQLIPQSDLDAARIAASEAYADWRSGEAAVAQAQAAADQASVNLEHTVIRSPIDGIVIERNVDVGQTLAASLQSPVLFKIAADLRHMQLQVEVDESDIGGLKPGEPAAFEVESYPSETFIGTVSQIRLQPLAAETATATIVGGSPASSSSPATTLVATVISYAAIVDVANPDERLRPGMTAEVTLEGSRRDHAVRIPNSALAFRPPPDVLQALGEAAPSPPDARAVATDGSGASRDVWQYDGRQFMPIAVHIGLSDDGWTELLSGAVRPGDALVTSAVIQHRPRL